MARYQKERAMTNVVASYELVKCPTIDWADYEENDPKVQALSDIGKNVLSALIILMYQSKECFGRLSKTNHSDIRQFSFSKHLRDGDITRTFNKLLKNKIVIAVKEENEQFFTVPRFFRRVAA